MNVHDVYKWYVYIHICEHQRSISCVQLYYSLISAIGQDTTHIGGNKGSKFSEGEREEDWERERMWRSRQKEGKKEERQRVREKEKE